MSPAKTITRGELCRLSGAKIGAVRRAEQRGELCRVPVELGGGAATYERAPALAWAGRRGARRRRAPARKPSDLLASAGFEMFARGDSVRDVVRALCVEPATALAWWRAYADDSPGWIVAQADVARLRALGFENAADVVRALFFLREKRAKK